MSMVKKVRDRYNVVGMAYSRAEFKNKVEEKVGGALFEYLKAQYAQANGETRWVAHWTTEVKRLIDSELVVVLLHTASFKNKRKAAGEVLKTLRGSAHKYMSSARKQLETSYFKRAMREELPDGTLEEFFRRVEGVVNDHTTL